jgi:hypothetical protein
VHFDVSLCSSAPRWPLCLCRRFIKACYSLIPRWSAPIIPSLGTSSTQSTSLGRTPICHSYNKQYEAFKLPLLSFDLKQLLIEPLELASRFGIRISTATISNCFPLSTLESTGPSLGKVGIDISHPRTKLSTFLISTTQDRSSAML